jgi:hypothetical protein
MVSGQVALHTGVAVNSWVLPEATVGDVGPIESEVKVMTVTITLITVFVSTVVPLSVAFTKIPTVPPVLPALKVTDIPLPLSEPRAALERFQR